MPISALVTGQNIINMKRREIDAYLRIINAFIATCTPNAQFFSNRAYLKVGGGCALSLGMEHGRKIALYRGLKSEQKLRIANADALRLNEIDLVYECLPEATDRFISQLHTGNSFAAFSQSLVDQSMVEPWVIEVKKRSENSFHAQLCRHPGKRDSGRTRSEAIAHLLISCQELFNIRITDLGS